MFNNIYEGKKVIVTGHTGFKGAWLTKWLTLLGAEVMGISNSIPTEPSMFRILGLEKEIIHRIIDIRDAPRLEFEFESFRPDYVFHLAAQAIVSTSYENPLETISTNVIGTANVLESIRKLGNFCIAVIITSDKCYENVEWEWGYREIDRLGGRDIYSASKGAAEVVFQAYFQSFFKNCDHIRIASARAGNVIGGGDWAKDRIIVDAVLSWNDRQPVQIRSPKATRPWQHVMEPLSGYLWLGASLSVNPALSGESFNFGPRSDQNRQVVELIRDVFKYWNQNFLCYEVSENIPFHEASLLKLNCDKAFFHLRWEPTLSYEECVEMVGEWYAGFYLYNKDVSDLTKIQISKYMSLSKTRGNIWTIKS